MHTDVGGKEHVQPLGVVMMVAWLLLNAAVAVVVVRARRSRGSGGLFTSRARRIAAARQLQSLLNLSPTEFEQTVAAVLRASGWRSVQVIGSPGDLAADIIGVDPRGRRVAVQCKRYAPGSTVGSPEVQKVLGMATVHHRADGAMVVTTSTFTQPAIDLARRHDVELVNGDRLVRMARQLGEMPVAAPAPPAVPPRSEAG